MNTSFETLLDKCARNNTNIQTDSRRVMPGDIFVAVPGENVDGALYISQAIKNGAESIVCAASALTTMEEDCSCDFIIHDDPREAVWRLAQARWHNAAPPLGVVGITGTNGKTTSAFLLDALFKAAGYKTGVLGTISYQWPGFKQAAPLTTPDSLSLRRMLADMTGAAVDIAVMEVSSHALVQQRVGGIPFTAALFTNLTQDHLDFHKDMKSYFQAKSRLFIDLPKNDKATAINGDDPWGRILLERLARTRSFGLGDNASGHRHLKGEIVSDSLDGLILQMRSGGESWRLRSPLVGAFNAMNLLGVQALALEFGLSIADLRALEEFQGVPGRLERVKNPRGLHVFIDYAHTPDALINALKALRETGFKRIITVFGCGGNRDRGKRPLMGQAVAKYADVAVLTSDNPRMEDPEAILNDVKPGLKDAAQVIIEVDRREATRRGVELLGPEDALLIAGKGHEDYQIIGARKIHYSDHEVAREFLN